MRAEEIGDGARIVGQGVARLDGLEKVTGRAVYGVDVAPAGCLTGKILRSPLPHARLLNVETARARRVTGVRAVLTGGDTPGIPYGFFKHVNPRWGDKLPLETAMSSLAPSDNEFFIRTHQALWCIRGAR